MSSESSTNTEDLQLRAQIDRSLRFPLLFFFICSAVWLVFGTALGLLSACSLNFPTMLEGCAILSYGRVYPAHMNVLIYGWGMQAGFGVALWLMARLCRVPLKNPATIIVAGLAWNVIIKIGIFGILIGKGTSILWLDFPAGIWYAVLITYVIITIWMVGMFAVRRDKEAYISQWYIIASLFWFPWVYIAANSFIGHEGGSAVMKAGISAWYVSNMIYVVLAPIALASAYYIVPKVIGRPIYSYSLANLGFWALIIFGAWSGMNRYMGGPLPAWMPTIGSTAMIMLLIPGLAVTYNLMKTLGEKADWANYSPSLRFTLFGVVCFVLMTLLGILLSIFPTGRVLQFTHTQTGFDLLATYGFFSMTIFGAIYFIVPRVTGCEWPNGKAIRTHFWLSAYGIGTIVAFMIVAGLAQGHLLNRFDQGFDESIERSRPYLGALVLGWGFIVLANISFLFQLVKMAFRFGRRGAEGPTLIHKDPEDYFTEQLASKEGANA